MIRRLSLLAAALVPAFSFAQVDINIQMKNRTGVSVETRTSVHQEQQGDGFRVAWDADPDGDTWFKVLSPEGAQIRVLDDNNFPVAAGTVPVSFRARGKRFYQVELRTPAGAFVKKFEAKEGMVTQIWVSSGPAVVVQVVPPAPVSACGPESDLQSLSSAIEEESFSAGKLRTLEDAMQARGVCVDHAVRLIKLYDFEADKLNALKLMAPRLTDRQNKFKIYKAFDFDSSRDEAKKILK